MKNKLAKVLEPKHQLKLLSYNIQAAAGIRYYHGYFTDGWRYLLPHGEQRRNLHAIADLSAQHDIIGLQETDAGSFRSANLNQSRYIADSAGLAYSYNQTNRRLGRWAQHSLGFLSRFCSMEITEIRLPGKIPGRGAVVMRFGGEAHPLIVINVHLALGKQSRRQQLDFLGTFASIYEHVILMGDFNCAENSPELQSFCDEFGFISPTGKINTYPSWRPKRSIDHILLSDSLRVTDFDVIGIDVSDHLPVSVTVELPAQCQVAATELRSVPCYSMDARNWQQGHRLGGA